MTSYQEVFERKEVKYRLDAAQRHAMLTALEGRMAVDDYGTTSIGSRYFDTPDRALIERSLDKPLYKEKLRVRSYGIPSEDDQVFVELKRSTRASCTSVVSAARTRQRGRIWAACPMSRHVASSRCPTRFSLKRRFRRGVCRLRVK